MKDEGQLFFLGQAVTLEKECVWFTEIVREVPNMAPPKFPEFGKIYHVGGYYMIWPGEWEVWLVELGFNDCFPQRHFVPVISSAKLETMLAEAFEGVIA